MSSLFDLLIKLLEHKDIKISYHGYDELAKDNIYVRDVIAGVTEAVIIEDYPGYPKGPCVLVL